MKKIIIILPFIFTGTTLPAQSVKKITGASLESYISHCEHPLIINFWATFCSPCTKEIPYLQATTAKYKDSGAELLLVSLDLPSYYPARILSFAIQKNITVSIAWLNEQEETDFHTGIDHRWDGTIPSTLFINNKTHYHRFFGRQLTALQVEEQMKLLVHP